VPKVDYIGGLSEFTEFTEATNAREVDIDGISRHRHTTKFGAGRICGADLNGDNLRIYRAYLRISVNCMVRVWVRVRVRIKVRVRFRVSNGCIQTAGEGDKMRINHVIKNDQWRCAPQIRPAPHFVVSRRLSPFNAHYLASHSNDLLFPVPVPLLYIF